MKKLKIKIVVANYYQEITDSLTQSCIEFLDHNRLLSDHKPIKVSFKCDDSFRKDISNHYFIDKKALYEHNISLLQNILDSNSPEQLCDVFNLFANLTIKKQKFHTFSTEKRIKDLEKTSTGKWDPENIRKACASNFNDWFNSNVKDKHRKDFDKTFHNTAKRCA